VHYAPWRCDTCRRVLYLQKGSARGADSAPERLVMPSDPQGGGQPLLIVDRVTHRPVQKVELDRQHDGHDGLDLVIGKGVDRQVAVEHMMADERQCCEGIRLGIRASDHPVETE